MYHLTRGGGGGGGGGLARQQCMYVCNSCMNPTEPMTNYRSAYLIVEFFCCAKLYTIFTRDLIIRHLANAALQ